jgi:hypothetical protein
MTEDPWDYVHITTWNFLPFLLRRVGAAPGWVVQLCFAVWITGMTALGCTLWRLREVLVSGPLNDDTEARAAFSAVPTTHGSPHGIIGS